MLVAAWVSIAVLGYVYLGYPLLLRLIVALRGLRRIARADITPPVSFVISAYNEAPVIRQKLTNALQMDYPAGLLQIAVVSDASEDETDDIVREFASAGVELMRQEDRRGKTAGLNAVVPRLTGDVIVFSDANAIYRSDAIRKLVRNFADPEVGCVTGESRYTPTRPNSAADFGERAYWDYEIQQKRLETAIGSTVGGDGAIYAIRRSLWQPLPEAAINDFLNPLQIVAAGWRAIYEPEAVCFEETAGGTSSEYRRRVRIVSRSWRAIFQAPGALNPFRVGLFALSLVSHKVLRWWSGLFLFMLALALALRLPPLILTFPIRVQTGLAFAALFALALPPVRRLVSVALYFIAIHLASLEGVVKGTIGRISGTWRPSRQETGAEVPQFAVWPVLLILAAFVGAAVVMVGSTSVARVGFWSSIYTLAYVYVVYPLLITVLALIRPRPVQKSPITPRVALLILANDEADVIEAKLQNSVAVDYPRPLLRIVVASDGSVDQTNDIVRSYAGAGVELMAFPHRQGKMATINAAMAALNDVDAVVFSDANVFLQPWAVRELVANLGDPDVGAVSGDVVLVGDRAALARSEDLYYRYERWLQKTESALGSMIGVDGALYAIRRPLFVPQAPDTVLDDMAIPMAVLQQNHRVVFEPAALASEQGSQSAWEEFSRKTRVVAGAAQFLLRGTTCIPFRQPQVMFSLVSHKILRWLSPCLLMTALVCSGVLLSVSALYTAFVLAHGGLLALGLAGCAPALRRFWPIGLAHYYCLVQGAAAAGFLRGLRGRQPTAWERFSRTPVEGSVAGGPASTAGMS